MGIIILLLATAVLLAVAVHLNRKHEALILKVKIAKVENRTQKWETKLKLARLRRLGLVEIAKLPSHHVGVLDYGSFDRKVT